jgi:hypothetical protein
MSAVPPVDTVLVSTVSTATMLVNALPYFGFGLVVGVLVLGKIHVLRFIVKRVFRPLF